MLPTFIKIYHYYQPNVVNTSYMNPVGEVGFAVKFEGRCNVCVDISMNVNSNEEIVSPSKNIFLITSIRMWT